MRSQQLKDSVRSSSRDTCDHAWRSHLHATGSVDKAKDRLDKGESPYGAFTTYCLAVNYILGVGVLGAQHDSTHGW